MLAELSLPLVNAAGGLSLTIPYLWWCRACWRWCWCRRCGRVLPGGVAVALSGRGGAGVGAVAGRRSRGNAHARGAGRVPVRARHRLHRSAPSVLVAQTRHVRQSDLGFKRRRIARRALAGRAVWFPAPQKRAMVQALSAPARVPTVSVVEQRGRRQRQRQQRQRASCPASPANGPSLSWVDRRPRASFRFTAAG